MQFRNRKNQVIHLEDGRELWLSRSVAVTVTVLAEFQGMPYVLINQRGPGLPDAVGLWNMPCGYLDYDESTGEAALREVWEECGVNLSALREGALADYLDLPWDINSRPDPGKQNVTIHHALVTRVAALPAVSDAHNEPFETTAIAWTPLPELQNFEFAFNHASRIGHFVEFLAHRHSVDYREFLRD